MNISLIDTRIGTDNDPSFSNGNALPYTGVPFAMNYFAVQNGTGSWWFDPKKKLFEGFRCTHQPSPWMGDFSHFLISPYTGSPKTQDTYHLQSTYRPDEASFLPHYNKIESTRYALTSELTASTYGMKLRSRSSRQESVNFVISATNGVEASYDGKTLTGTIKNYAGSEDKDFTMYFTMTFNQEVLITNDTFQDGSKIVIIKSDSPEITLSFASSFISKEQSLLNLSRDVETFDEMKEEAKDHWLRYLNRIEVKHHNEDELKMFYNMLYRTFLFPMTFFEINEENEEIHYNTLKKEVAPGKLYTNNGFWDTYKSLFPLFSLIAHEEYEAMLEGFLNSFKESGYLPKWLSPDERGLMPGTLVDAVISDAITKGIGLDKSDELYKAMVQSATTESDNHNYGRHAVNDYTKLGYVPSDYNESVNQTLDNAYSDFCIAQVAKQLNKEDDYEYFIKSSNNYKNIFDKETKFMRTKDRNGKFVEGFKADSWSEGYTEGSAWQNSWAVYHDFEGLINLFDSRNDFLERITDLANQKPTFDVGSYGFEIHEMSELAAINFGQVAISNQPSFHLPYLYTYVGKSESTEVLLRQLMKHAFKPTFDAFPGDEDNGSMSAWFIFNACGFYPVCPGSKEYVVGIPLLDSVKIHLSNGKTLNINTEENHDHYNFINKMEVNDKNYDKLYLKHDEIMQGMKIDFELGLVPRHKEYTYNELPYSQSLKRD